MAQKPAIPHSPAPVQSSQPHKPAGMQVTTKSAKARAFFNQGIARMETLHWEPALQEWRQAAKADPHFALAHILLSMLSRDPVEQVAEREKALASKEFAG